MQAVWPPGQELQEQGRKGRREEEVDEQIRNPDKQGNVVWSKGVEEARNGEGYSKVLWLWRGGAQQVEVSSKERKQKGKRGTTTNSMGKGEKA